MWYHWEHCKPGVIPETCFYYSNSCGTGIQWEIPVYGEVETSYHENDINKNLERNQCAVCWNYSMRKWLTDDKIKIMTERQSSLWGFNITCYIT